MSVEQSLSGGLVLRCIIARGHNPWVFTPPAYDPFYGYLHKSTKKVGGIHRLAMAAMAAMAAMQHTMQ